MRTISFSLVLALLALSACSKTEMDTHTVACTQTDSINTAHSKAARMQQVLDDMVQAGVPGIALAIHTPEGYWAGSAGFAKIETSEPMHPCHLQYGQSVAKTYLATAILMLFEDGKIDLDGKITDYLAADVVSMITDADQITVRMLMNHTSGIPEYNDKPQYVTYLLQHPLREFTSMDYLEFIAGMPLLYEPGSRHRYTNTNYVLLALIADSITGDHTGFINTELLSAHGLTNSCYHSAGCFSDDMLVNTYWDRYSNGEIENCSQMQIVNVQSLVGDDGIVATPIDYIKFMQALLGGQIIGQVALDEMMQFVEKTPDSEDGYGLGIHRDMYNGFADLGHTGGGIGSGYILSYFPDKDAYIFLGINIGTIIYSPNFDTLEDKIDELLDILLE